MDNHGLTFLGPTSCKYRMAVRKTMDEEALIYENIVVITGL